MAYIFRKYGIACFLLHVFIVIRVLANTQENMFMKTLIDSYIIPILNSPDKDFAPLAADILRVACFYGVGVLSTFAFS